MRQLIITDGDNTFFTNNKFLVNDGIPTSGYFNKGDVIINTGSLAGTEPLYVCYKSGSPGSWGKLKFDTEYLTREEVIELILENATEEIDVSHLALKSEVKAKDDAHDLAIENIQKSIKVLEGLVDSAGDVDVSKLALKSDMNAKDKELEEDIKLLKMKDDEIVEILTDAQEAIQSIQYQNIDYTTNITSLKASDTNISKAIDEINSDIMNLEESIGGIHEDIEILEGLIDAAGDIDLTHLALKSDMNAKDKELEDEIANLKTVDTGLNNKITTTNENISLFNTRLNEIMENVYNKAEVDAVLENEITKLTANDTGLINKITTTNENLSLLDTRLNEIMKNVYNKTEVDTAIANLVDGAPNAMNTLNELANAINNNKDIYDNYVDTISSTIAGKADKEHGTHLTLGTTSSTAFRGDYGTTAYTHSQAAHAPSNAQKNSDITKAEIEAKLTGNITSHTHSSYATTSVTGSLSNLKTSTKTNLVSAINEVFQSGNDAKSGLVAALVAGGISAATSETFSSLNSKVKSGLMSKKTQKSGTTTSHPANDYIGITGLGFKPTVAIAYTSNYNNISIAVRFGDAHVVCAWTALESGWDIGSAYFTDNGVEMNALGGSIKYTWIAYE